MINDFFKKPDSVLRHRDNNELYYSFVTGQDYTRSMFVLSKYAEGVFKRQNNGEIGIKYNGDIYFRGKFGETPVYRLYDVAPIYDIKKDIFVDNKTKNESETGGPF